MRKTIVLGISISALLLFLGATAGAQTPPPSPAPVVVTATPLQQVIVVTATPSAPPAPKSFWDENGKAIIAALIALVSGVILSPLLRPLFDKMGQALAARLSKLGSDRGFKKRYLAHLTEEYQGLNIRGRKTRAPVIVELEQVYVSLHARPSNVALGRQEPPALDVGQALAKHKRLAILGGPGAGKTTLLAYLTLTYARDKAGERLGLKEKRLPILVPLRRLRDALEEGGAGTLPAYLTEQYAALGMQPREGFFEKALHKGRCLVLLDGLDEVADEDERRRMSEWVDGLVAVYPGNRYVVTSRPPGYESAPLEHGFTVLRVRDFTDAEIRRFAGNWCLAVELAAQGEDNPTARRRAREAASDLVAAIEANAAIRKLAVNPLLLSIIALVHRYRATLPRRRVDLYAECVDVLLGHWDAAKGLAGELSPGQKRAVLQPLALALHRENRRELSRHELERRIAAAMRAVRGSAGDAADFVDEVRERSGLLVEVGLGQYAFSHQTFQEYLCAREIVDLGDRALAAEEEPAGPAPAEDLSRLRRVLDRDFDEEELRTLCFELGVTYDDLPGRGQAGKARDLVDLLDRRGRVSELVAVGKRMRADVSWDAPPPAPASPPDDGGARGLLLAHVGDKWWTEVTLLYVGMADATPVVNALLESGDEAALLLAGRCVAEAMRLEEATREQTLRLLQDAFATCTGERFMETGLVLAEIAGEDSVGFFLRLARDDAERRPAALWSLGQMGRQPNEALRERVLGRLLAHFEGEELQQEAGVALLELWGVQVVAELRRRRASPAVLEQAMGLTMARVPAGEFLYGDKKQKLNLPEFWIDKTPVTNAEYKQFLDATGHGPPQHWEGGTYPAEKATHPVVYVSWHDAVAYAEWAGKRLPVEQEWEKAARGTDGRAYPWGDQEPTAELCNFGGNVGDTTPVGRYSPQGDSPYGCVDMAGNVWEWTASDYRKDSKVLRGGAWFDVSDFARSAFRLVLNPVSLRVVGGFRCVVAPTSASL